MKLVKTLLVLSLLLPAGFAIAGLFNDDFFIYALMSTMATGFLQVVAALIYLIINPENPDIKLYLSGVVGFFVSAFMFDIPMITWLVPPALCVYLLVIVFKFQRKSQTSVS